MLSPAELLGSQGPLARHIPGFAPRAPQQEMAQAVAEALHHDGVLISEAGTGTGKTYAYLVPAFMSGKKIIISTGTKNLQDQLYHRDLPVVRAALGVSVRTALLKGRANYLCLYRLEMAEIDGRPRTREERTALRGMREWAGRTHSGDIAEYTGLPEDSTLWFDVTSTSDNCLGQECPSFAECHVVKARRAAQEADLVVVNHHLLFADMALKDEGFGELLPGANAFIIDEAHQLPEVASSFFGSVFSSRQLLELADDTVTEHLREAGDMQALPATADALKKAALDLRLAFGHDTRRLPWSEVSGAPEVITALRQLHDALTALHHALKPAAVRGKGLESCMHRAEELLQRLDVFTSDAAAPAFPATAPCVALPPASMPSPAPTALAHPCAAVASGVLPHATLAEPFADALPCAAVASGILPHATLAHPCAAQENHVRWLETYTRSFTLNRTPLDVAPIFQSHMQARKCAWVFTSATLAVGDSFEHFSQALALQGATTRRWDSPFDFARNAVFYAPADAPGLRDPNSPVYTAAVVEAALPVLEASRGRAFMLFTSHRALQEAWAALQGRVEYPLLIQGSAPRGELLERFRALGNAILLGTSSFWEGVDVRGPALSCVIIDKLPFAALGDPILQARLTALRQQGGNPFMDYQLPAAVIMLKQGVGRLIRDVSDCGVMMICDPRLFSKPYGQVFINSLPPMRRTRKLENVQRFFAAESQRAKAAAGRDSG